MTYAYTFQAFMLMLSVSNAIFTILQAALWYDRYENFIHNWTGSQDYKPHRTKFFVSVFTLVFIILSWVFIHSNNLIP